MHAAMGYPNVGNDSCLRSSETLKFSIKHCYVKDERGEYPRNDGETQVGEGVIKCFKETLTRAPTPFGEDIARVKY